MSSGADKSPLDDPATKCDNKDTLNYAHFISSVPGIISPVINAIIDIAIAMSAYIPKCSRTITAWPELDRWNKDQDRDNV